MSLCRRLGRLHTGGSQKGGRSHLKQAHRAPASSMTGNQLPVCIRYLLLNEEHFVGTRAREACLSFFEEAAGLIACAFAPGIQRRCLSFRLTLQS